MIMIIIHEMAVILRDLQPLKKHVAYMYHGDYTNL